jgi:hypothetical protein
VQDASVARTRVAGPDESLSVAAGLGFQAAPICDAAQLFCRMPFSLLSRG